MTLPNSQLCSVVCTTYNHERFSADAIASIAQQDWDDLEIIIVDDGSTDGNVPLMLDVLTQWGRPYTLICQSNTGNPARNANLALQAAKGDCTCLMSLDDLLLQGCISSKMRLFQADPALVMVGNESYLEIKTDSPLERPEVANKVKSARGSDAKSMLELEYNEVGTFLLQGTIFRTSFLKALGGFDADMAGDDLNLRTKIWSTLASRPDLQFKFLQMPGFIYRIHRSNINFNTARQVRTVLEWRERYFPDRFLPSIAEDWVLYFCHQSYLVGAERELYEILESSSEARRIHFEYLGTWKHRKAKLRKAVRQLYTAIRHWSRR